MANTSRKLGARPVKHLNGSPYNGQFNIYEIAVGDGSNTAVGDFVKQTADTRTSLYPTVARFGTSGEVTSGNIIGAIVGFVVDPTSLNTPQYRAASTKRYAYVADSPDLIFEIEDGATVATPIQAAGLNCGVNCTAMSTTTGASNMTTGATAATTTNTLPLNIVGVADKPDNASASASQKLLVRINNHQLANGTTAA